MAQFSLSPSVSVKEYDLTQIVPSVATSIGAFAGPFNWGPCDDVTTVSSEEDLVKLFGKPDSKIESNWFAAKNFLDYSNFLRVVRSSDSTFKNAFSSSTLVTNVTRTTLAGVTKLVMSAANGKKVFVGMKIEGAGVAAAQYTWNGNTTTNLYVASIAFINAGADAEITVSAAVSTGTYPDGVVSNVSFASYAALVKNKAHFDQIDSSLTQVSVLAKYPGEIGNSLKVSFADASTFQTWAYRDEFSSSSKLITHNVSRSWKFTGTLTHGSDLVTNVVFTEGKPRNWAGNTNTSTGGAKFGTSFASGSTSVGVSDQVNSNTIKLSAAAYWSGSTAGQTISVEITGSVSLSKQYWAGSPTTTSAAENAGGVEDELFFIVVDEEGLVTGEKGTVLEKFTGMSKAQGAKDSSGVSVYFKDYINNNSNFVWVCNTVDFAWGGALTEDYSTAVANYTFSLSGGVADNSLITPQKRIAGYTLFSDAETLDVSLVVGGVVDSVLGDYLIDEIGETRKDCVVFLSPPLSAVQTPGSETENIQAFRNEFNNSTYAVMDSGWKQQYDRYNDKFVWVPLNGDTAGLCANVDNVRDPWWSPAGFNRGYVKNVVKLAYNPSRKADRDELYQSGINPVVTFKGEGTVLFGDRTMTTKTSAFQYINVRRLFILIEKAIATYSKFVLFEFNDEITRAQFVNTVTPYLRDIQGRRGIYDFKVVADSSVNTPEVVDSAGFVANILVKPSRSINFIQLNFVAVKSGASFEEVEF